VCNGGFLKNIAQIRRSYGLIDATLNYYINQKVLSTQQSCSLPDTA